MKKIISIIVLLSTIILTANSQARMWSTADEIMTEFKEQNPLKETDEDGSKYIQIDFTGFAMFYYYLNDDNKCYECFIMPDDEGDLHGIIERYNNKYVVVSDTQWKFYSGISVCYIKLRETKTGLAYFDWYLPKD